MTRYTVRRCLLLRPSGAWQSAASAAIDAKPTAPESAGSGIGSPRQVYEQAMVDETDPVLLLENRSSSPKKAGPNVTVRKPIVVTEMREQRRTVRRTDPGDGL